MANADNVLSAGDPEEQDVAKIGGPTAQAMGTEYQMISSPGTAAAEAAGEAEGEVAGVEQREDAGRDPEYYYDRQTAEGTADGGELVDKPHDITGEVGR